MAVDELLRLIEQVLGVEADTLTADTLLGDVPQWGSLSMLNLQIELTAIWPDVSFDALRECRSVGDICGLVMFSGAGTLCLHAKLLGSCICS